MSWVIRWLLMLSLSTQTALLLRAAASGFGIQVTVVDSDGRPVPGARIEVKLGERQIASAVTDQTGQASFPDIAPALYEIAAVKEGFETARYKLSPIRSQPIRVTLEPAARHESVKVMSAARAYRPRQLGFG